MTFSTYLRTLRRERRITLREMCQQLGMEPSHYSRIERGLEKPLLELTPIARVLRTNLHEGAQLVQLRAQWQQPPPPSEAEVAAKLPGVLPPGVDVDGIVEAVREAITP